MGYRLARLVNLGKSQQIKVAIEIGLQNGTLAVLMVLTYLHSQTSSYQYLRTGLVVYLNSLLFLDPAKFVVSLIG
jgi:predicted Na+-dependent transporter